MENREVRVTFGGVPPQDPPPPETPFFGGAARGIGPPELNPRVPPRKPQKSIIFDKIGHLSINRGHL